MRVIEHNKLVRDKIPEVIAAAGKEAVVSVIPPESMQEALDRKLQEELREYLDSHSMEELADLLEVIRGVLHHQGVSWESLESIRQAKYDKRGGFEKGVLLVEVQEEESNG